ncbi:MAG TPA: carboxylating nicotinate-nucleotide diphosphorylase [Nitrosomonas europaea]|uniref:carboxylating nicotinate-nucleotide diphosphorylase n=1 Tax=Nitrosomonas europaea TaxID=915 RepID=UPI00248FEE09|nr:carboxylating nicotinate-nucleotide diphosphorylase [Nitrosomonas europaea]HRN81882.1 carboxylating nicotinate-nucleotide diphosphorylase [Nitrosomonas europaea]HRO56874.1 carboxylating nicotinate-nucleotide diphosphorylase [Nitrosomonas europaea]HRQ08485.1 carboxylating nicotinate-nucleotide diphosphorylase [Nitrosomonas europaea]HUM74401.1 carboxylating nicotinate-nucleotide diphosphorylase [Nitrosomonas europaea]
MLQSEAISNQVRLALSEDIGTGDLTASLIPPGKCLSAQVIVREAIVICGIPWFDESFRQLSPSVRIDWHVSEGQQTSAGQTLCVLDGDARALLTGERTALNFLQMLSAVATRTRKFVEAIEGTGTQIVDTRKTLPGLRLAQKYAVRCGGGVNHRTGLYDGILIKENHIIAAGSIEAALRKAIEIAPPEVFIQIEVETQGELMQALSAGARMVLLDNFDLPALRDAVAFNRQFPGGPAVLEASGNVTLDTVRAIAETGVDRISIGSLTKDVRAVDLSMRFYEAVL